MSTNQLDDYNVIWESPSKNAHGSMPIGNGDLAANVWVEPNGDLVFYLSKSDAWSGSQELLKLGRVRVTLDPPLYMNGFTFTQELDLATGSIRIDVTSDTRHPTPGTRSLSFWVDANHPVVNVEIESAEAFSAQVVLEPWRTADARRWGGSEPDTVLPAEGDTIRWYQRNTRSIFKDTLAHQHLGHLVGKYADPLINLTFGGLVSGKGLHTRDARTLVTKAATQNLLVRVHALTAQTATPEAWIAQIHDQRTAVEGIGLEDTRKLHQAYWENFWGRSWIYAAPGSAQVETAASSLIPSNTLTFRFGSDPSGGNRFSGQLGRATLVKRALGEAEIKALADTRDKETGLAPQDILYSAAPALYSEIKDSAGWTDSPELTVEAWINPAAHAGSARILDKTLPGSNEGFLLDTHPGNSLRLIMGNRSYAVSGCLEADQWHHVAVVVDAGRARVALYLDGRRIAGQDGGDTASDAFAVTRAYVLQRWIQAGAGRGAFPIKFNGSLFTVDGVNLNEEKKPENYGPDMRQWGGCYWFQNTREPYWAMLYSGDFDHMEPLWKMYRDALPLLRDRTRKYFDHEGIFCSETIYPWGLNRDGDFGRDNKDVIPTNPYIRYYWDSGNELSMMMLDCYAHTQDRDFATTTLIPIAEEVVKFYDQHYKRNAQGKVHFTPAASLETWHTAEDPLPVVVGLHTVLTRLLELPETLTTPEQRQSWDRFRSELPDLPFGEESGKKWIEPARTYSDRKNSENPELYAVFPYRAYAVGRPDLDVGLETWQRRRVKGTGGWRQDAIQAALLGLTGEAREFVTTNATDRSPIRKPIMEPRFPAFWGPNFDWLPDQCQGSVTMIALQRMLMQCEGDAIRLLPAWPKDWGADFKLHAPHNTTVEGRVENGELLDLKVTPKSRTKDVEVIGLNQLPLQ